MEFPEASKRRLPIPQCMGALPQDQAAVSDGRYTALKRNTEQETRVSYRRSRISGRTCKFLPTDKERDIVSSRKPQPGIYIYIYI